MSRLLLTMLLAATARACAPAPSPTAPPMAPLGELPPDNVLTTDPAELAGTWHSRPTAADPRLPDIVVVIDRDRIHASSGCVRFGWSYRFIGTRLELTRLAVGSCKRGLTAEEAGFAAALGAATVAYHRGGRGLIFEGPRGRVALFEHPPGMTP